MPHALGLPTAAPKQTSTYLCKQIQQNQHSMKRAREIMKHSLLFTCKANWNFEKEYLGASGTNQEHYPPIMKSTWVTEKLSA